jgi:hypothetical protein
MERERAAGMERERAAGMPRATGPMDDARPERRHAPERGTLARGPD